MQKNVNSVVVVNFQNDVDRLEENSDTNCAKEKKIVFLKTHKVRMQARRLWIDSQILMLQQIICNILEMIKVLWSISHSNSNFLYLQGENMSFWTIFWSSKKWKTTMSYWNNLYVHVDRYIHLHCIICLKSSYNLSLIST